MEGFSDNSARSQAPLILKSCHHQQIRSGLSIPTGNLLLITQAATALARSDLAECQRVLSCIPATPQP